MIITIFYLLAKQSGRQIFIICPSIQDGSEVFFQKFTKGQSSHPASGDEDVVNSGSFHPLMTAKEKRVLSLASQVTNRGFCHGVVNVIPLVVEISYHRISG